MAPWGEATAGAGQALPAIVLLLALPAGTAWAEEPEVDRVRGTAGLALRCPRPQDPNHRHFECHGLEPDFERTLFGDWNHLRQELAGLGITPTISYTGAYFGNSSNPPREGSYGGGLHAAVNLDIGKLGALEGLSAYLDLWWTQASNVDSVVFTNLFPASAELVGNGFWLGQLYLEQKFAEGDLSIAAGRLGPGATLATLPVFANYSSAAINGNPRALELNEPPFTPPPPGYEWGVQALYSFSPRWQGAVGVYNNSPSSAAGKDHGLDWHWRSGNRGALTMAQLNWLRNQGPQDRGLPGQYSLGAFWDGNSFPNIAETAETERGNWGVYLMGQQQISGWAGKGSAQGLTLWGTVSYSGKQAINPLPSFAAGGASYQGPLPSRPNDVASIACYYGRPSNQYQPPARDALALELAYQYSLNGAVNFLIDAQYLLRVNGYPSPGTAVLGAQVAVTF